MTLSTSVTERTAFTYMIVTVVVAFFGGVYEIFSHGVWSGWMVYAFVFPLALGALPFSWLALRKASQPRPWFCRMHHAGVATLTAGSIIEGVLAIYGTTNELTVGYWIVGTALLAAAQIICMPRK